MIQEFQQQQYNYADIKFISKLGDGGFGIVYLAHYKDEKVAVKIIKNPQNKNCTNTLKKEIEILEDLHHPRLIKLLGHNEVEIQKPDGFRQKQYYIILEFAQNGNLFQYMKMFYGFDEKICRYYFKQLLEVLLYLQNKQVCHRDIKLENILLDENYDLKLADFGFAKKVDEGSLLHEFIGTAGYKAPEIQNKIPYDGFKADIFSLGVLLFTLYAGYYPLYEKQITKNREILKCISNKQFERFWNIQCQRGRGDQSFFPNDFKNLIEGMLHPDPKSRFTLDECLNHVWRNGETATKDQVFKELNDRKNNLQIQIEKETVQANNQINTDNRSCWEEKRYHQDIIKIYKLKFDDWQLEKGQIQVLQNQIITHHDVKTLICELIFKMRDLGRNLEIDQKKFQLTFDMNMNQMDQLDLEELQQEQQDSDEEEIEQQNLKIMIELQKTEQNLIIVNVWKLQGDCLMFLNAFQKLKQIIKNIEV